MDWTLKDRSVDWKEQKIQKQPRNQKDSVTIFELLFLIIIQQED